MELRFSQRDLTEIRPVLQAHLRTLASPIDSFLEDHIVRSNHYRILVDGVAAGWTAIHQGSLITQFGMEPAYRHWGQPAFARVRKLESVREAFVPTCDEFFLAHALDDYRTLEKQAYFFQVQPDAQRPSPPPGLTYRQAGSEDAQTIRDLSGDFLDRIDERAAEGQLYLALWNDVCAGFGVIEPSTLYSDTASIGMFTAEHLRGRGVGTATIGALIAECTRRRIRAVAGCWYYNHLSKKTLEKAGMFTQTRLLRISY